MTLLERTLHEIGAAAAAGLLPARAVVVWPQGAPDPGRDVEIPAGLRVEHVHDGPSSPRHGRWLLLAGNLLVGPGALREWLLGRRCARPGLAEIGADDPDARRPAVLAERLSTAGGGPELGDGSVWMRIADDPDARRGERLLFASLAKASDGFAARHLNRPISTRLSRWLARARVPPNAFTAVLLVLTGISAAVLMRGDTAGFVLGAILFNLISILDGCDGELARVRYRESARGARLDTLADMLSHHVFVVALGVGLARQVGLAPAWQATYFAEGVLTAVGIALALWGAAAADRGWRQEGHFRDFGTSVLDAAELGGLKRRIGRVISDAARQDTYHWIFIAVALAGFPAWILHVFAGGVVAHLVALAYVWVRGRDAAEVASRPS